MANQTPEPTRKPTRARVVDDSVPTWLGILCAVVIIVIVAVLGYTLYADRQAHIAQRENACSVQYERYTDQWQNCVNDG